MKKIALALLLIASPAQSQSQIGAAPLANVQLENPEQERAAKALMETIRCLVCQGQSIADSDAEMAGDMRSLIRTRIAAGESPEAIQKWLIERYGNYVTYSPPMSAETALLWFAPFMLLLGGAWLARGRFRRGRG
jgi:cytochrome c-type biogenesis protein CcmH